MKRLLSFLVVGAIAGVAAYAAFFALYPGVKEWMGLEWHPAAFTAYFVSLGATAASMLTCWIRWPIARDFSLGTAVVSIGMLFEAYDFSHFLPPCAGAPTLFVGFGILQLLWAIYAWRRYTHINDAEVSGSQVLTVALLQTCSMLLLMGFKIRGFPL